MYSRFANATYGDLGGSSAKVPVSRNGTPEWTRSAPPSSTDVRDPAHEQCAEIDYEDELCYVAVLGEK